VPLEGLAGHAVHLVTNFTTEELSDEFIVSLVVSWVKLFGNIVLKLCVFLGKTIWDLLSSEEPDTLDLELWFLTEDSLSSEGIFGSVFSSVQETVHQVVGNVFLVSLTFIDVVMEMPERPAIPIEHFVPGINTFSAHILMVDEEGLEVIEVERSWWKRLDVVLLLLLNNLLLNWLWCFLLLCWLFLLNNEVEALHWFGAHLNVTADLLDGWESVASLGPGGNILHDWSFSLSGINDGLESEFEGKRKDDIGDGNVITNEPFLSLESGVDDSEVVLQVRVGSLEVGLFDGAGSENTIVDDLAGLDEVAVSERNPLVDLGSLGGVLTKMRTLERAEIFADGGVILECSLAGGENWHLIEDVHIFPFLGFLEISSNWNNFELLTGKVSNGSGHGASWGDGVVNVKFHFYKIF